MKSRRFIIPFLLASVAGHALILSLTAKIGGDTPQPPPVVEVKIEAGPPPAQTPPSAAPPAAPSSSASAPLREDSVSLQDKGGPYQAYLLKVRRRIEELWRYPPQALARSQEGDALIRFTITADGSLAAASVVGTSGAAALDEGALSVVLAAAPYDPLPGAFKISRLHVTAIFSYRLNE